MSGQSWSRVMIECLTFIVSSPRALCGCLWTLGHSSIWAQQPIRERQTLKWSSDPR
ncbi:hypothetical protein PIB30_030997 [Stylosanthes scabra]|uniref:Uncharacterized protein n=1 Tax=Stylosanthes scabra TaxID=79078 RepID=A0ABU6V9T6_9FABA|nr:hypothetical protein [Stylosanthes scabra]